MNCDYCNNTGCDCCDLGSAKGYPEEVVTIESEALKGFLTNEYKLITDVLHDRITVGFTKPPYNFYKRT